MPGQDYETSPVGRMLKDPFGIVSLVSAYVRTKSAVRINAPLYDLTQRELEKRSLQGPWTFNITESVLAGIPVMLCALVFDWLGLFQVVSFPDEVTQASLTDYYSARVLDVVNAYVPPFVLTTSVYALAWASLRAADRTPERLARARRAYLYFDGAFGLIPQMVASACLFLGIRFALTEFNSGFAALQLTYFVMVAVLVYTSMIVGRSLYKTNGYLPPPLPLGGRRPLGYPDPDAGPAGVEKQPPRGQMNFVYFLALPLISILLSAVGILIARAAGTVLAILYRSTH